MDALPFSSELEDIYSLNILMLKVSKEANTKSCTSFWLGFFSHLDGDSFVDTLYSFGHFGGPY